MRVAPAALDQTGIATNYNVRYGTTNTVCSSVITLGTSTTKEIGHSIFNVASGLTIGLSGRAMSNAANAFLGWSAEL
jgi:hypothetical protein